MYKRPLRLISLHLLHLGLILLTTFMVYSLIVLNTGMIEVI